MNSNPEPIARFLQTGTNHENVRRIALLSSSAQANPHWLELVASRLAPMHFGSIQIVVEDSEVVQIEIAEKRRFNQPGVRPRH